MRLARRASRSATTPSGGCSGSRATLQRTQKTQEGAQHPDRDAQFRYVNQQAKRHLAAGQPVVSVDTKKKELVGRYANGSREWQPAGEPERVLVHDFPDKQLGKRTTQSRYALHVRLSPRPARAYGCSAAVAGADLLGGREVRLLRHWQLHPRVCGPRSAVGVTCGHTTPRREPGGGPAVGAFASCSARPNAQRTRRNACGRQVLHPTGGRPRSGGPRRGRPRLKAT
jgi:hypothetical protein